jgi:hypothetical protein
MIWRIGRRGGAGGRHEPMAVVALDTHEVVKELRAAGFTDEQAEAVTRVVRKAQDMDLSNLTTKTDLAVVATRLDLQLGLVATKTELAETKAEILKWMVGSIGIQTVVIIGAVIALVRVSGKG